METIKEIIVESVSGGLFRFLGYWLMVFIFINSPIRLIEFLVNRPLRHWTIRKHGYPPAHCDADGDFKTEDDE